MTTSMDSKHKKDGLVCPVATGTAKNDAKNNDKNKNQKTRFNSDTEPPGKPKYIGKCGYCSKWGNRENECNDNPANHKYNPEPPRKRQYP